jgi:hypothetical protein
MKLAVCLLALFAVVWATPAGSQQKPGSTILTKDGRLVQELEVHEWQGSGFQATSRRWTIRPDGDWILAVREFGVSETKGKLTKEKLAALADDLARYGVASLFHKVPVKVPPNVKIYEVRWGKRQTNTVGPLPKPDDKSFNGRYAGIIEALERHLPAETKDPGKRTAEEQAVRLLMREQKARLDGVVPPVSWPEKIRRVGTTWIADIDTSRLPGGYPQQIIVEVSMTGGHTGKAPR